MIYKDFNKAKHIAFQAVSESKAIANDTLLLQSYINLSNIYLSLKQVDSSLYYCVKALPYAKRLQAKNEEAILYNRQGIIFRIRHDFKEALRLHEKALSIAKTNSFFKIESDAYKDIARLYREKKDIYKAFETLEKAIQLSEKHRYKVGLVTSYNIKGLLYFDINKDSTLHYYNQSLKIARDINAVSLEALVLSNIGDFYLSIKNAKEAIEYLKQAEKISEKIGDVASLYYINVSLGIYNEEIGDLDSAVKRFKSVLKNIPLDDFQRRRLYWLLSGTLWFNGAYKEAFDYQERYIYLNDTIFNLEKEREFETLRTQYDVEKKEHQIVTLEKEKALERSRKQWILVSAVLLILPLVILFLFYRNRAKTQNTIRLQEQKLHAKEKERLQQEKALKETQALVAGQDKERERIAKELHDGVGGQLASINLNVSHINTSLKHPSLTAVNHALKDTFKELRALSHDLSYNYHQDKSMYQLLAELKQNYTKSHGLLIDVSIFPKDCLQKLDVYTKHNLYRVLQEVLANTAKHAKSQHVNLSMNRHEAVLVIILEDDGIGFDVNTQKGGIGLKNIRERVMSINGKLTIDSVLGQGTSVIIEILTDTTH
jgi:signal transduction histidine kinase